MNNFDNKKFKSNLAIISFVYKLSLLLIKSERHLKISFSYIFLSTKKFCIKFNKGFKTGSKIFALSCRLKSPRVKNKALHISIFVFTFNKLLQKSKKEYKYFSLNNSLFILYKLGMKLINSILIKLFLEFFALKILFNKVL